MKVAKVEISRSPFSQQSTYTTLYSETPYQIWVSSERPYSTLRTPTPHPTPLVGQRATQKLIQEAGVPLESYDREHDLTHESEEAQVGEVRNGYLYTGCDMCFDDFDKPI